MIVFLIHIHYRVMKEKAIALAERIGSVSLLLIYHVQMSLSLAILSSPCETYITYLAVKAGWDKDRASV